MPIINDLPSRLGEITLLSNLRNSFFFPFWKAHWYEDAAGEWVSPILSRRCGARQLCPGPGPQLVHVALKKAMRRNHPQDRQRKRVVGFMLPSFLPSV